MIYLLKLYFFINDDCKLNLCYINYDTYMSWSVPMVFDDFITGNNVKNTQAKVLWKRKGQSQQKNFEKIKLR